MPAVLSAAAEHAESEIHLAHGLFQRSVRCLEQDFKGRTAYTGRMGYGVHDLRIAELAAGAVFRIMGAGEQFARIVLDELVLRVESSGTPIERALMGRGRPHDDVGWRGILDFMSDVFGISVGGFDKHDALSGFVEARNAVAHGGRRLTPLQMKNVARVEARLRSCRIELDGRLLKLDATHVRGCREVILGYVDWLDGNW